MQRNSGPVRSILAISAAKISSGYTNRLGNTIHDVSPCGKQVIKVGTAMRKEFAVWYVLWLVGLAAWATEPALTLQNDRQNWPLMRGDGASRAVAACVLAQQPELLWQFRVPNGSFESTPAIVAGTVFVADLDGNVYALDWTDGNKKWQFQSGSSFQASPAVSGGRVYLGNVEGTFYCLNAQNGQLLWSFSAAAEIDGSANFYRDRVLFGSQDAHLYCLSARDGTLLWKFAIADQIRCTPTIISGHAFVAGCDSRLHVIDVEKGTEVTAVDIEAPTGVTPAAEAERVYFGTEAGTFFGVDWRKGQILWRYQLPDSSHSIRSSPCLTPQAVVFGGRDKRVHALHPNTGKSLWVFEARARVDCSPVAVEDRILVGAADGRLYALDSKTGHVIWQTELRGGVNSGLAIAGDRLIAATDAGVVYCFGSKQTPP